MVGCVPSAIIGLVPRLLTEFTKVEPRVPWVSELNVEEQLHALRTSKLDVGVFRIHQPCEEWPSFDLIPDEYCLAIPTEHEFALRAEIRWSDLATRRFVISDRSEAPLEFGLVVANCVANGFSPNVIA
ncbi:LysR substrate-binding domain-containing protein [bacterium RCC_150]